MKQNILPVQRIEMDKDTLNFWKGEIKSSLKRQKSEFIDRINYDELVRYFEALQFPGSKSLLAIVDEFSPAILSVITSVYYQNPTVQVEAANPEADKMVQPNMMYLLQHPEFQPFSLVDMMKGSLTYGMTKSGMKEEMQVGCFDLMLAGYAAIEMNHSSIADEAPQEDSAVPSDDVAGSMMQSMVDGAKSLMGKLTGSKTNDEVEDEVMGDTQSNLRTDFTDKTYCKRYNPLDIFFDPRADVFKESRWVGKRIRMTVAEFNAKYPQLKGKVLASSSENYSLEFSEHNSKENKKAVTLYEIEIKKKGPRNCVLVLHPALDEPVDYYERAIITNNFAVKYGCIDKYGKIYPMSRGRKAKGPQDDINHYMTIQFEHVDRSQRKVAVYMDGLTESGKTSQKSSDVYALVEKKTPQAVYEPMPAPSVVPENKEIVIVMKDSINKSVGTTELAKGGKSQNDTLGQDQLEQTSFQVNVNSVQDALQDLADQIVDELKDIQQQVWDGEDYFKVTGIQGGDAWYTPEMGPLADILVGDYSVRCNISSSARPNPAKERQDLMEMTTFITSPPIVQFAMMHGKRPSMEPLNNLIKQYNMVPEMVFETLEPIDPLQPQGNPPPPNANIVPSEGSRITPGAASPQQGEPQGVQQ
jgi:hypothetical protein